MSLTFTQPPLRDHIASRLYAILDPSTRNSHLQDIIQTSLKVYNKKVHTTTRPMFTLELFTLVRVSGKPLQELRSELDNALKGDALITLFSFQGAYLNFSVNQEAALTEINRIFTLHNQKREIASVFFPPTDMYSLTLDKSLFATTEIYARILEELGNNVNRNLIVHDQGEKLALSIAKRDILPPYLMKEILRRSQSPFDLEKFIEKGTKVSLNSLKAGLLFSNIKQITVISSRGSSLETSTYFNNLLMGGSSDLLKDEVSNMIFDAKHLTVLIDMNNTPTDDAIAVNAYQKAAQLGITLIAVQHPNDKINIQLTTSYSRTKLVAISETKNQTSRLGIYSLPTGLALGRLTAKLAAYLDLNDVLNYQDGLRQCVSEGSLKPIVNVVNATITRIQKEDDPQTRQAYTDFLSRQLRLFSKNF